MSNGTVAIAAVCKTLQQDIRTSVASVFCLFLNLYLKLAILHIPIESTPMELWLMTDIIRLRGLEACQVLNTENESMKREALDQIMTRPPS